VNNEYLSITQDEKLAIVASAIVAREAEMFGYNLNISNYEAMLKELEPGEWRDKITALLDSERRELAKSESVYRALLSHMPEEKTTLIATAKSEAIAT
jgi:hypothetical protein